MEILVSKENFKTALKCFKVQGLRKTRCIKDMHMCTFESIGAGRIKLHYELYENTIEEFWLKNKYIICENLIKINTISNTSNYSLGINDNLIYITLNLIKHTIYKGMNFRMIMDLLLYFEKYKDQIDFQKYDLLLEELNYTSFIEQITGIGILYMGFNKDDLPTYHFDEDLIKEKLACSTNDMTVEDPESPKSYNSLFSLKRKIWFSGKMPSL